MLPGKGTGHVSDEAGKEMYYFKIHRIRAMKTGVFFHSMPVGFTRCRMILFPGTICLVLVAAAMMLPVLSSPHAEGAGHVAIGSGVDASALEAGPARVTADQFLEAVQNGFLDNVKECLDRGIDMNVRNEKGESALHLVKDAATAEYLISRGADVNLPDRQSGMTPLFFQEVPIARLLVAAGANVNARSLKGNTPLIWFAYSSYLEGIEYLLSVNADLHAVNDDGKTVLDVAEDFGSPELVEYLREAGAKKGSQNKPSEIPEDAGRSHEGRP